MSKLLSPQLMALRKESMKAKDKLRTATLGAISAAFKQILIDERKEDLTKDEEIIVLKKMIKQRVDSATQFNKANRKELEAKERAEIEIIEKFLPSQISEKEIEIEIDKLIASFEVKPPMAEMGKLMVKLAYLKSTADMSLVSKILRSKL